MISITERYPHRLEVKATEELVIIKSSLYRKLLSVEKHEPDNLKKQMQIIKLFRKADDAMKGR